MAINRAAIKKQLQEGLDAVFGLEYKMQPELWRDIFAKSTESKKAYIEQVLMSGLGAAPVKVEGGQYSFDEAQESWVARLVFETVALAVAITEEAQEDDLYADLGAQMAKALARSMQYTKNVKGANVLNYGYTAGYTGGDGKTLFATDHPLAGGGTFANTLTTQADLSETSLEDMLILIGDTTDDRGLPIHISAKKLIVPTELQFTAQRLLKTDGRVGTADNDINALKSLNLISGGFSTNVFLSDPDQWTIITDAQQGLQYVERSALKKKMDADDNTGNLRYRCRERYGFFWADPRGAFGSSGA
jgi:hypothetical protein